MKWKGRRVSKNVEDQTDDEAIRSIIENSTIEYTGLPPTNRSTPKGDKPKKPVPDSNYSNMDNLSKGEKAATKELGRLDREGKTPTPTPRPKQTQVTPGKWKTN